MHRHAGPRDKRVAQVNNEAVQEERGLRMQHNGAWRRQRRCMQNVGGWRTRIARNSLGTKTRCCGEVSAVRMREGMRVRTLLWSAASCTTFDTRSILGGGGEGHG